MDNLEITVVIAITSLLSIYEALGARYNITEVPWLSLLTRPKYFGGLDTLIRNLSWLVCWIIVSNAFMIICAIIIKSSETPISRLYHFIGYQSESGGKAGLATLIIVTASMYLILVKQTAKIVAERFCYIPKDLMYTETKDTIEQSGKLIEENINLKNRASNLIRQIYYIGPSILAPIYSHFWKSAGLIKHGCVRLLYDRYGEDNILEFYREHSAQTPDREIIDKIDNEINRNDNNRRKKAFAILSVKISKKGYHNTNGLLNNFLVTSPPPPKEKRSIERIYVNKSLKLNGFCEGKKRNLTLIEYSEDGSSIYVLSKWPSDINKQTLVKKKDNTIHCDVIHRNARTYQGRVRFGLALRIVDENEKKIILNIVKEAA